MSSLSSYSSNFSNPGQNHTELISSVKSFLCCNCNHAYDSCVRQNTYVGRVPLILNCKHTVCQECVTSSFSKRQILCNECGELSTIAENDKRKIQEIFPVNLYLMGALLYVKPNQSETMNMIGLKPASTGFKSQLRGANSSRFNTELSGFHDFTTDAILQEKCKQELCNKLATLRCLDCVAVYCDMCCQKLHQVAGQSHKTILLNTEIPEVTQKCIIHVGSPLDFHCSTCDKNLCCYCVLQGHNTHNYTQLTTLDNFGSVNFEELIQSGEKKLQKLISTYKRVRQELAGNSSSTQSSPSVDIYISKYFTNLHAKLQILEHKLRDDALKARNINSVLLNDMKQELVDNIRTLKGLLTSARSVNDSNSNIKFNVKLIIERLENALKLPCYLVGKPQNVHNVEFVFEDIFSTIEENCFIKSSVDGDGFRLVGEDEAPEGYDTTIPNEMNLGDLGSLSLALHQTSISPQYTNDGSQSSRVGGINNVVTENSLCIKNVLASPSSVLMSALRFESPDLLSNSASVVNWMHDVKEAIQSIPPLKKGDHERVIVTHIDSPESIYVHVIRFRNYLQEISQEILRHVRNFAPIVKNPEINKLYVVKHLTKGQQVTWHRGRIIDSILDKNGEKLYNVFFIDYGHTRLVNAQMLRETNDNLVKFKPFAVRCQLFNLYPAKQDWSEQSIKIMMQVITGGEVALIVMNDSDPILEVDLIVMFAGDRCSIRDALIFIGHAESCGVSNYSLNDEELMTSVPKPKLHTRMEYFKKDQWFNVVISHVVSPDEIYLQEAEHAHHIEHLNSTMSSYYTKRSTNQINKNDKIYVPKKEMVVAVYYKILKQMWYRGIVKNVIHGQGMVEVYLVDVGAYIRTCYTNIRRLPEMFHSLECQAILVRLVDIVPPNNQQNWSNMPKQFLNTYVAEEILLRVQVYELGIPLQVALFESSATIDTCINALLVQEKLAEPKGPMGLKVEWVKEGSSPSKSVVKESSYVFDLLDTIQSTKKTNNECDESDDADKNIAKQPVNVLNCISPDLIYVAFTSEHMKKVQINLQQDLYNHYSAQKAEPQQWAANDLCVVYNPNQHMYYRAVILEEIDDAYFKVLLRDIGEMLIISKANIMKLENQFKQVPDGTVRCHLAGITPAGDKMKWSGLAIELVQDVFKNYENILLSKNGPIDKIRKSIPVIMWYSEFKPGLALEPSKTILRNINKLLIDKGLAFKDRMSLPVNDEQLAMSITSSDSVKSEDTVKINKPEIAEAPVTIDIPKDEGTDSLEQDKVMKDSSPKCSSKINHRKDKQYRDKIKRKNRFGYCKSGRTGKFLRRSRSESKCVTIDIEDEEQESSSSRSLPIKFTSSLSIDQSQPESEAQCVTSLSVASSSQNDWKEPVPFKNTYFYGYGTCVDDDANIFLHQIEFTSILKTIEKEMKSVFDSTPPEPKSTIWIPGQLCTVKYFMNNNWYRGKILNVIKDVIKVHMIDYGNEEECKHEDLRLNVMYPNLPAFANRVKLHQVFPKSNSKWLTSDLDELHKLVVDKRLFVTLHSKNIQLGTVPYATIKVGDLTVNKHILTVGSNLVSEKPSIETYEVSDNDDDDVIIVGELSNDLTQLNVSVVESTFMTTALSQSLVGKKINAGIVSILNYNSFIFELLLNNIEETKDLFNAIYEDIEQNAARQPVIYDLKVGQACVTKYLEDGKWYRAEIMNLDRSAYGVVEVWYVDFGNFEYVPRDSIRRIDPAWLQLPVIQYIGKVDGIELKNQSDSNVVFEEMSQFCGTVKIAEIISVDPLHVKLYESNEKLLYQNLIDRGVLISS